MQTSRFITNPDIVQKGESHTVVLIDASIDDIERVGLFCKVSNRNYDIYLYNGATNDLEWLSYISDKADQVLQATSSLVTISSQINVINFDEGCAYQYFQSIDE